MPYSLSNKRKSTDKLEPEEEVVQEALRAYTSDPEKASCTDFVITKDLYKVYVTCTNKFRDDLSLPERLNRTQFGVALRRVFDLTEEDHASRRRINGKLICGYVGLKGPLSFKVRNDTGRNPKGYHDHLKKRR